LRGRSAGQREADEKVPWNKYGVIEFSRQSSIRRSSDKLMYWFLVCLGVALVAAIFGFGGIASASVGIAQIRFVIFLVLFLVAIAANGVRGRNP
jgi:uncharacterized membrane protein YtjA (UPF0391 family)